MILNLRIHGLRRPNFQFIHTTPTILKPRRPSTPRSWQSGSPSNWSPRAHNNYIPRRPTLVNYPHTRPKNRCRTRTSKSNRFHGHTTRRLLRTMLRNLWRKSQLHTNCRRTNPTKNLWNRTCTYSVNNPAYSLSLLAPPPQKLSKYPTSSLYSYPSINLLS